MTKCVRFYSDGSKKEFIPETKLQQKCWIEYNKIHRFGTALVVGDQYIVGTGYPNAQLHAENYIKDLQGEGYMV